MHENCGKIKAQTRKFTWFRFYHEALNDPKIQMLEATIFKGWINCLCLAAQNDGTIPNVDRLAFALRLSPNSARDLLDALILAELIDIRSDGTMEPHNWTARQYKSDVSTERVKKHREKRETASAAPDETQCNVSLAVSETPPDTEAETEQIQIRTPLPPKGADVDFSTLFADPNLEDGVSLKGDRVVLVNGTRAEWLERFGGDENRLDMALIEARASVQPNSRQPIKLQVERILARVAGQKRDSDRRYSETAKARQAAESKPPQNAQPSRARAFLDSLEVRQ